MTSLEMTATRKPVTVVLPPDLTDTAVKDVGPVLRRIVEDAEAGGEVRLDAGEVGQLGARALGLFVALRRMGADRGVEVVVSNASAQLCAGLAIGGLLTRVRLSDAGVPSPQVHMYDASR